MNPLPNKKFSPPDGIRSELILEPTGRLTLRGPKGSFELGYMQRGVWYKIRITPQENGQNTFDIHPLEEANDASPN